MFAIEVTSTFSAAHALRLPNGKTEPLHGHDFRVTVKVACEILDELETVADFHDIEKLLHAIIQPWQSHNLNDFEPFKTLVNPSAERIAEHIGTRLQKSLAPLDPGNARNLRLLEVRLTEAHNCLAIWSPE